MARVVVSGYMLRYPLAGNVAAFFQYVLGLRRLGHEVVYVEEKGWPGSCYDPVTASWGERPLAGLSVVRDLVARHCPDVPVVFVDAESGAVDGLSWTEVKEALTGCDLLLDVGGTFWLEQARLAPRRALVDLDPVFTQLGNFAAKMLDHYDVHFTVGANLGQDGCTAPTAGVDWLPTVPPVVLDLWDAPAPASAAPLTTIANWSAYGGIHRDGVWYGQKDVEFRRLLDLPARVTVPLELALSGASAEVRREFAQAGWQVVDGGDQTRTLSDYRSYIASSRGELTAAKHAYVATRSGWFSDRTVGYLAAGRPAIVQDTGFTDWLPAGRGVLAFTSVEEAADAVDRVGRDLAGHSRAARRIARERFDHRVVLPRLLARTLARAAQPIGA